jgi:hypothetical protein
MIGRTVLWAFGPLCQIPGDEKRHRPKLFEYCQQPCQMPVKFDGDANDHRNNVLSNATTIDIERSSQL